MRERVQRELSELLVGRLATPFPGVLSKLAERRFLRDVVAEYREATPGGGLDGRLVVVTAGPPGAGKSTATNSVAGAHRVIDPDEIKLLVVSKMESLGLLDQRHGYLLADGRTVSPAELSGWVHAFSTAAGDLARDESLRQGENIVLAGTLQWDGLPLAYVQLVEEFHYEHLTVLDIEVPRDVAEERAKERWWRGRIGADPLGGRFLPPGAMDRFYTRPGISVCSANARKLYELAAATDPGSTEIRFLHTGANDLVRSAIVTTEDVVGWDVPGIATVIGAACARCGAPLTSAKSIRRGYGDTCRRSI